MIMNKQNVLYDNIILAFTDIPVLKILHTPLRAALDSQDSVYCSYLRVHFMAVATLFPQ